MLVDICYLAQGQLVRVFGKTTETTSIGLHDYFASYGWEVSWKGGAEGSGLQNLALLLIEWLPTSQDLLAVLRSENKGKGKRTIHTTKHLDTAQYSLLKKIKRLGLIANIRQDQGQTSWTFQNDRHADALCGGHWLEYYVYDRAATLIDRCGKPLFQGYGWGVEDKHGKGEVDFAGIFDGQILLVSCKTEQSLERRYFEDLQSKAQQLGRGMCSTLLVSTVARISRTDKDIEKYFRWASERQIVLALAEDIPILDRIIRKIVLADERAEPEQIPCYPRI